MFPSEVILGETLGEPLQLLSARIQRKEQTTTDEARTGTLGEEAEKLLLASLGCSNSQ